MGRYYGPSVHEMPMIQMDRETRSHIRERLPNYQADTLCMSILCLNEKDICSVLLRRAYESKLPSECNAIDTQSSNYFRSLKVRCGSSEGLFEIRYRSIH